ncbi:MAG: copper amine oxidase, partial [Sedimentibacter sp.]|nr:copper amine oxidase [Sedimentibacter sp.]
KIQLKAYNIDNNNYFKLRDIAEYIDFEVDWDNTTNSILINTNN